MICVKCQSENVNVQVINEVSIKNKHHSVIWWLFLGWWWIPLKWILFFLPALIIKIFSPNKKKVVNKEKTKCVCQSCGYTWDI